MREPPGGITYQGDAGKKRLFRASEGCVRGGRAAPSGRRPEGGLRTYPEGLSVYESGQPCACTSL
ncbi:hypothetical protein GCM10010230_00160 [Streptomyces narbonensis]|nr:hypothetical protein GCM10010230_00160 [Streptomyces narbonensis]